MVMYTHFEGLSRYRNIHRGLTAAFGSSDLLYLFVRHIGGIPIHNQMNNSLNM